VILLSSENENQFPIGGQALVEGVMMRGKDAYSIALLTKQGEVKVERFEHKAISERYKIFKIPFIRGIGALWDSMKIGIKALLYSANEAMDEIEKEEAIKKKKPVKKKSKNAEKTQNFLLGLFSIIAGFGLFVAVPNLLLHWMGLVESDQPILFNIISGGMRILFFIAYVAVISLMKDVRRVFMFHGAEHKSVNTYEAKEKIDIDNVKKFPTFHPRCGTSFMFFVLLIAIIVFSFVPLLFNAIIPGFRQLSVFIRKPVLIMSHILLLPVVAGISYEFLKLTYKGRDNFLIKILSLPGYGIQKLTTREPDENMVKCAIVAINAVIEKPEEHVESKDNENIQCKSAAIS
jgi:uncharacterized protein YqhQ